MSSTSDKITPKLMQWNFVIERLLERDIKLKNRIWLKKKELFLEKKGEILNVFLLGDDKNTFGNDQKILPFVKISTLLTNNAPILKGGGGGSIQSTKEFGKQIRGFSIGDVRKVLPKRAIKRAEKYAPIFLKQIKSIHDKYSPVIEENKFLQIALDYFYDSETKFVYSDEGFISVMISLEALFNDGSYDIKYKLAHRAAFLLGLTKFPPTDVFEELKNFYDYRSGLVHGGGPTYYDPDRYKISRYARWSMIVMTILLKNPKRKKIGKTKRKKELLKEIDHAMLIPSKRKSLEKEIMKDLKNFKLKVPRTFEGKGENGQYRVTVW